MLPKQQLTELEAFIALCQKNPCVLYAPELSFFKHYIESLGGVLPPLERKDQSTKSPEREAPKQSKPEPTPAPADEESDVELDNTGVIEPDDEPPQPMGDSSKEVSEEDVDKSDEKKMEAMGVFAEGNHAKAIELLTEAIELNPGSALLHAKRASCYLQLNKPNACIRDCNKALELNPDSASAYKFRGRAHRLLGRWEEAAQDLRTACKIDYDDQANEWLKEVTPNAKKLEEHQRSRERKKQQKLLAEREERLRHAKEEHEKAAQRERERESSSSSSGGGFRGPAGGIPDPSSLFNDPDIMAAFQDPEVAAAFADVSSNPNNITKYQDNPKIAAVINKLAQKIGGGGMGGGMFPGMGGMGGGMGGFPGFPEGANPFDEEPGAGAGKPGDDLD